MADGQHGGYRRPSSPAAVSGPGALSQRTDGRPNVQELPDAKYGEAQQFHDIQTGAPMGAPPGMSPQGGPPAPMPTGLGEPSANPGEPVTAGADAGAGPNLASLGIQPQTSERDDLIRRYGGSVPVLVRMLASPKTSDYTKDQIRHALSVMGAG